MRLHQLAAAVDLPVTSVKHYLREGLLPPGEKLNVTTARYGPAHVHRLELIRDLRRVVGMGTEGIRQVVAAVEGEPPRRMMGRIQTLVALPGGDAQAPEADGTAAAAADDDGPPRLTAAALAAEHGWSTATDHAWSALDAHLEAMRSWGLDPTPASVAVYARAADAVARTELAPAAGEAPAPAWAALGPDPSPDQLARYVAVGVHAHAQLLLRLLAVAQGHHARAGAPGPSAPSRGH